MRRLKIPEGKTAEPTALPYLKNRHTKLLNDQKDKKSKISCMLFQKKNLPG